MSQAAKGIAHGRLMKIIDENIHQGELAAQYYGHVLNLLPRSCDD